MEENVIEYIKQAEAQAADRRAEAQARAAEILADAEKRVAEMARVSERDCAKYRADELARAEVRAREQYQAALKEAQENAKRDADKLLENADAYVPEILGRILK